MHKAMTARRNTLIEKERTGQGRAGKMKQKILALVLCVALLSACGTAKEQPTGTEETAGEAAQEILYHGGEPRTPEETLAQTLTDTGAEVPLCPDCAAELRAVLTDSEELPAEEQDCLSMVQGTDAVYKLSLRYEWKCDACGYADAGHTVEGTKAVVCHGWTS